MPSLYPQTVPVNTLFYGDNLAMLTSRRLGTLHEQSGNARQERSTIQ